ncbi:hypothetical protein SCALM49S_03948 [Streptomyces californicus]
MCRCRGRTSGRAAQGQDGATSSPAGPQRPPRDERPPRDVGRQIKVWFRFVPREDWLPYDTEGLWATRLSADTARRHAGSAAIWAAAAHSSS